jgi:hypothetical protein
MGPYGIEMDSKMPARRNNKLLGNRALEHRSKCAFACPAQPIPMASQLHNRRRTADCPLKMVGTVGFKQMGLKMCVYPSRNRPFLLGQQNRPKLGFTPTYQATQ